MDVFDLNYSQAEANPPHTFTKVEEVAPEATVIDREGAITMAL